MALFLDEVLIQTGTVQRTFSRHVVTIVELHSTSWYFNTKDYFVLIIIK